MKKKKPAVGAGSRWMTKSGYLFVAPFMLGALLIFLPSLVESLVYAFHDVKIELRGLEMTLVGLENFRASFLVDTRFRQLLLGGLQGMVMDSIQIMIFSFFVANILNQNFIGRSLVRTIFFLPVVLSTGIVSSVAMATRDPDAVNQGFFYYAASSQFGASVTAQIFSVQNFLYQMVRNQTAINVLVYFVYNTYNVINSSGVQILVFISALKSINPAIFEASKVEGASKWEEFWKITFPIITPMIFVNFIYTIIDSFTNPYYGILSYIRTQAFNMARLGYASALSWIYFLLILVFLGICTMIFRRRMQALDN